MTLVSMADLDLKGKRVLIREDFNVPMKDGEITSDARIVAALPTLKLALKKGAKLMLMSHFGRPQEGIFNEEFSLAPVRDRLEALLKKPVRLVRDWQNDAFTPATEAVILFDNVRFHRGEKDNDPELARKMAELCDVFVMDAFATAHREEVSTAGVIAYAPIACAGPLLLEEVEALDKVMAKPARPLVAIIGGAKVSTKLKLLSNLSEHVDVLITGGGIANTFLAAKGYDVGRSLYEPELLAEAMNIMEAMEARGAKCVLPEDVVVAPRMLDPEEVYTESIGEMSPDEKIFDVGPKSIRIYETYLKKAGTILWSGPVGAFEVEEFSKGTEMLAKAIAASPAVVVAGGGDTILAIDRYQARSGIDYISTGGGAFLACLQGEALPSIAALEKRGK